MFAEFISKGITTFSESFIDFVDDIFVAIHVRGSF
jgi:hypothetical protein